MHELSVAVNIVDMAAEEAERRQLGPITAVHLKLGPLCGVLKDYLVSAFELAREGSRLANAELVIEDVPIVVWCPLCDAERPVASIQQMQCPACGTPTPEVRRGRELEITALEVVA